jgi:type IV pilus assembly protein PilM
VELPEGLVVGSLTAKNIVNEEVLTALLRDAFSQAGLKGSEIGVVLPDDSVRIAFLTAENLPGSEEERESFVRWKLKKTMPFDVDSAQVAFSVVSLSRDRNAELLVALAPKSTVEEFENVMQRLDIHAGFVTASTLAALNLHHGGDEDSIFVKIAPGCITTTVFQDGVPRFYRRVADAAVYDAVYPTVMYYQDKLGGGSLAFLTLCGYEAQTADDFSELQTRLGLPVSRLEPRSVDDIYKAALGAVDLAWANLV